MSRNIAEALSANLDRIAALEAELKQAQNYSESIRLELKAIRADIRGIALSQESETHSLDYTTTIPVHIKKIKEEMKQAQDSLARVTKERDEILAMLREVTFRGNFAPNDYELELRACEMIRMLEPDKKGGGACPTRE